MQAISYSQATDKKQLKRTNNLIKDIQRTPFEGIGKPESLKFNLSGFGVRFCLINHFFDTFYAHNIIRFLRDR